MNPPKFKMIIDRTTLSSLSKFLSKATNEVFLQTNPDGLSINFQVMGGLNAAIIHIPRKDIKELTGNLPMTIDTSQFEQAISLFDGEEVTLEVEGEARLYIYNAVQQNHLDLLFGENKEPFKGLKINLPAKFTIDASELLKMLNSFSKLDINLVRFNFNGNKKEFQIVGAKTTAGFKKMLVVKEGKGEGGVAIFQTSCLLEMLTGASGDIAVEIGNDLPIKFTFSLGKAAIQSFVSPRIERD